MANNDLCIARSLDKVIGVDGMLPWHCPTDLRHFKELSSRYDYLICGSKTYETLPVLKDRRVIVASNRDVVAREGDVVMDVNDLDVALESPRSYLVIGGAKLALGVMPYIERVYLTTIKKNVLGQTGLFKSVDLLEVTKFEYSFYVEFKLEWTQDHKDCKIQHFVRR